jgi:hypothetical protein
MAPTFRLLCNGKLNAEGAYAAHHDSLYARSVARFPNDTWELQAVHADGRVVVLDYHAAQPEIDPTDDELANRQLTSQP